jgi:hypothetical protein
MHGMDTVERLRTLRRDLHRIPEVGFDLPETIAYVSDVLARLSGPVEVFTPCPSTVCAFFDRVEVPVEALHYLYDRVANQDDRCSLYDICLSALHHHLERELEARSLPLRKLHDEE